MKSFILISALSNSLLLAGIWDRGEIQIISTISICEPMFQLDYKGPGLAGQVAGGCSPSWRAVPHGPGQDGRLCQRGCLRSEPWQGLGRFRLSAANSHPNPFPPSQGCIPSRGQTALALNDYKGQTETDPRSRRHSGTKLEPKGRKPGALVAGADAQAVPWS